MNDQPAVPTDPRAARHFQLGVKNVMLLVAVCGIFIWSGWMIWANINEDESSRGFRETLEQLRSADSSERWRAAGNLSVIRRARDIDPAVGSLIAALKDQDNQVKVSAAETLGSLIRNLRNPADSEITAESELVKKYQAQATTALVALLADKNDLVRQAALIGLGQLSKQPNSTSRGGGIGGRAPTIPGANAALPKKPSWQPPPELSESLETGETKWTRATAQSFYGYVESMPPPPIVEALKDPSASVRLEAVRCLANFPLDLDAAIPLLVPMLERDEPEIHNACLYTVRTAWPTAAVMPSLTEALKVKNPDTRAAAILLLGRIGREASATVPALLAILKEPPDPAATQPREGRHQDSAVLAARALGQISSSEEVVAALRDTLSSPVSSHQGAAAFGLAQIGESASVAAPALVASYRKWLESKGGSEVGRSMATALGRIAPKTAVESDAVKLLGETLESKDEALVEQAARALARFGKQAAPAASKLRALKENDKSGAGAAAAALEAIEGKLKSKETTHSGT